MRKSLIARFLPSTVYDGIKNGQDEVPSKLFGGEKEFPGKGLLPKEIPSMVLSSKKRVPQQRGNSKGYCNEITEVPLNIA